MEPIKDIFALTREEIDYRIMGLKDGEREILTLVIRGKSDQEISALLSTNVGCVRSRIAAAVDKCGAANRSQLIALYSSWVLTP